MKILFLSPILPLPLESGGRIRVYHLIKALSHENDVILVSYIRKKEEEKYLPELKKICHEVLFLKRNKKPWSIKTLAETLFSTKPLLMNLYQNKIDLSDWINWADLIWQECFYTSDISGKKLILGEQNIEYLAYQRYLDNLIWWKKIFLWLPIKWDLLKMRYWEKKSWKKAKKIVCVSQADKKVIEKESGRKDIQIIPNGVDAEKFTAVKKTLLDKTILFVGEYKWFPNRQAIDWLVKEIFPKVKQKIPEAKLLIVGKHMPKWLGKLGDLGDIRVDEKMTDIREAYSKAGVFLAALKSGGGTKYKILEAMAMEVPVVTTSVGVEGFGGFGDIGVIREKTEDLAETAVDVLENPEKFEIMTKKAREYVQKNFDWKVIEKEINEVVKS